MKIALLGYGKMGKVIERIALERGHEIVLKKDQNNSFDGLLNANIAIDFSVPDSAVSNITECLNNQIPVISGTTGWLNDYQKIVALCEEKKGSFIYSSNFSLGVNIFFELNEYLSKMMANLKQYTISMEEIHHMQKLDAPSGTAITLAEGIIKHTDYTKIKLKLMRRE
jgi:4-hydroxy-tetrahydrodipicolinate reductase